MAERPQHASLSLHVQQKRRALGAVKKSLLTSYDSIVLMTASFLACCDQRHSPWDGGVGKCWELWEVPVSLRMGLALRSFCRTWKHSLELSLVSVALFYTCSFQCSWFVLTRTWQALALEPLKLWAKQMASWWIVRAGSGYSSVWQNELQALVSPLPVHASSPMKLSHSGWENRDQSCCEGSCHQTKWSKISTL